MKKTELLKAASALAFDNVRASESVFDSAMAAKAAELQLADPDYRQLKQWCGQLRGMFVQAAMEDDRAAKQAAAKADGKAAENQGAAIKPAA